MADHKITGDVNADADLSEGGLNTDAEKKPTPGALVEDETLVGTKDGGVVAKDPTGHAVEGEATDVRENPTI